MGRLIHIDRVSIIFILVDLFLAGCFVSYPADASTTTTTDLSSPTVISSPETPNSVERVVQIGIEKQVSTIEGFQNDYSLGNNFYLFNIEDNNWYELNTAKDNLIVSKKTFLPVEEIIQRIVKQIGVDSKYISIYISPSRTEILFAQETLNDKSISTSVSFQTENPLENGLTSPKGINYFDFYTMDLLTNQIKKYGSILGDPVNAIWSPNENYVVIYRNSISAHQIGGEYGMWLIDLKNSEMSKIAFDGDDYVDIFPKLISNDGSKLIFDLIKKGSNNLLLVDIRTKKISILPITSSPKLWWLSDDTFLYLATCQGIDLYKIKGYTISSKNKIHSSNECINMNLLSSFIEIIDGGKYIIYRHIDSSSLYGRSIVINP